MLSIIVAVAENNVIGKDNKLIWHLPEDLKRFKRLTTGHTIIMGRKTFESLGRVLPNRKHVILCNDMEMNIDNENVEILEDLNIESVDVETSSSNSDGSSLMEHQSPQEQAVKAMFPQDAEVFELKIEKPLIIYDENGNPQLDENGQPVKEYDAVKEVCVVGLAQADYYYTSVAFPGSALARSEGEYVIKAILYNQKEYDVDKAIKEALDALENS